MLAAAVAAAAAAAGAAAAGAAPVAAVTRCTGVPAAAGGLRNEEEADSALQQRRSPTAGRRRQAGTAAAQAVRHSRACTHLARLIWPPPLVCSLLGRAGTCTKRAIGELESGQAADCADRGRRWIQQLGHSPESHRGPCTRLSGRKHGFSGECLHWRGPARVQRVDGNDRGSRQPMQAWKLRLPALHGPAACWAAPGLVCRRSGRLLTIPPDFRGSHATLGPAVGPGAGAQLTGIASMHECVV